MTLVKLYKLSINAPAKQYTSVSRIYVMFLSFSKGVSFFPGSYIWIPQKNCK